MYLRISRAKIMKSSVFLAFGKELIILNYMVAAEATG